MPNIDLFLPLNSYIPSLPQLVCFVITFLIIAGFYYLGAIFSGPNSISECRIITGWGVSVFVLVFLGAGFQISLKIATLILVFMGLVGVITEWRWLKYSFPTNIFQIFCTTTIHDLLLGTTSEYIEVPLLPANVAGSRHPGSAWLQGHRKWKCLRCQEEWCAEVESGKQGCCRRPVPISSTLLKGSSGT